VQFQPTFFVINIKRGSCVPDNVLNRADNNKIDMPTKGEGTQMY